MKKSYAVAAGCFSILAIALTFFQNFSPIQVPVALNCPDGVTGTLSWSSKAMAPLTELKKRGMDAQGLAREQGLFLRGLLHFGLYRGQVTPLGYPEVSLTSSKSDDLALHVSFNVRQKVLVCSTPELPIKLLLPLNPIAAYDLEPASEWIKQSFNGNTKLAPACAFSQVIDFSPVHFWYVWSPFEKGHHAGKSYDCEKKWQHHPGIVKADAGLSLEHSNPQPLSFEFFDKEPLWKIRQVWGFIGEGDQTAKIPAMRPEMAKLRELALNKVRPAYSPIWDIEPSIGSLYAMMMQLNAVFKWSTFDFQEHKGHFTLMLRGKGIKSGKDAELEIFLGPSIPRHGAEVHQELKKFWLQSLEDSPLVFYTGHAEIGLALPLEIIPTRIPQHQLIGLFACFSTSYWVQEDFKILSPLPGTMRDLVSMGYEGYAVYASANLLTMLEGGISSRGDAWKKYLKKQRALSPIAWNRKVFP